MAADIAHTNSIVRHTRLLFLCFAYLIGCVTAIYLQKKGRERENETLKKCDKKCRGFQ